MELSTAESDAKEVAMKDVAITLSKTDQLDRLEQYKRKVQRKKATLESQLRNAVQTQLEGVQTGLKSLKDAEHIVQGIKDSMNDVEQLYQQCADLSEVVRPIKDVNRKHQQLKTTTTHIHNIFNVPEAVKETRELITEGNLLEAHRNLSELEHTRDELLVQLFHGEDAFVDKNTSLHHYFEPLLGLSDTLGQHLWVIMHESTRRVSSEPTTVVTALRIVEREERADTLVAESLKEKNIPVSQLPGRPKDWRSKCFEILETSVTNKFEELVPMEQERLENRAWLGEHLTEVAAVCFQDLKNVKEKGQKCFPPSYDILNFFVTQYHHCLVKLITDLVHMNLNAKDIIYLMVWVGDVRESFREELDIDFQQYGPLIDPDIEEELQQTCQELVGSNIRELITKMLETEKEDWYEQQPPEEDINGAYYSTIGITLFQMIDQNISALAPLGMENKLKVLKICLDAMVEFQEKFKALVEEYFKHHMQTQRREPPFFIHFMIAAANSCRSSVEFAEQLRKRFIMDLNDTMMDASFEKQFKKLAEEFESIAHQCCGYLLDGAFVDLNPVLQGMLTKDAWFGNPGDLVGKIEGTMFDYNEDFSHLKPAYHSYLMVEAQHRVMLAYMTAFMQKRMVFKKDKDRERASKMISEEVKRINTMFLRLSHATNPKYSQVIEQLAELLKSKSDILPLDISGMVAKHPDIKSNHIIAVLSMRGDLNKSLVTKILQQTTVTDQTDGGDDRRAGGSAVSMRKKADERNFLAQVPVPNPYSLFGK